MTEKKIPLLITGGMPDYLMENILTDGYDMKIVNLTTNRQGNASHPNAEGAKIQGAELAEFIRNNYPQLFN